MSYNLKTLKVSRSILFSGIRFQRLKNFTRKLSFALLKVGCVYRVEYLFTSNFYVHRKFFVGICLKKNKNSQSFLLRNFFKGNSYEFCFFYKAPSVISISCLKQYKRKVRLLKIYYIRNLRQRVYKK